MRKGVLAWILPGLLWVGGASGAPFCVEIAGVPPQCLYVDAGECQRAALRAGGACGANAAELRLPPGYGPFCLVGGVGTSTCVFPDRASCQQAARRYGACVAAEIPADPLKGRPR